MTSNDTPHGTPVTSTATIPSDKLVSSFLRRLQTMPQLEERTAAQWQNLERESPSIARFIMACSYQAAPDDPAARSMITTNMLYLHVLLGEARLHEELSRIFGD